MISWRKSLRPIVWPRLRNIRHAFALSKEAKSFSIEIHYLSTIGIGQHTLEISQPSIVSYRRLTRFFETGILRWSQARIGGTAIHANIKHKNIIKPTKIPTVKKFSGWEFAIVSLDLSPYETIERRVIPCSGWYLGVFVYVMHDIRDLLMIILRCVDMYKQKS